jgi:hypothetical protein
VVDPGRHRRRHDAKYVTGISGGAIGCHQLSRSQLKPSIGLISEDQPG